MIHPPPPDIPLPGDPRIEEVSLGWPFVTVAVITVAFAIAASVFAGCAELGPVMGALPGVVSAVEAVTAAAKAQGRPLDAEVLAEAKALDAAHEAAEKARDKKLAAILAAVKRKPVACVPVADAGAGAPGVVAAVDAGTEAGR